METKLQKYFDSAKYIPDKDLSEKIWSSIVLREKRKIRLKIWSFSLLGISSLFGLFPAVRELLASLQNSGFYEYLSVLFSENGSLATYWQELSYSIAESLPLTDIILALTLIFVLFLSIRYWFKQIIKSNYMGGSYVQI